MLAAGRFRNCVSSGLPNGSPAGTSGFPSRKETIAVITFAIATGSALLIARRASRWTVEQHLEDMSPKGLAVDPRTPTRVYCGESGGLWRSDDAGRTWSPKLQSHVERAQRTHREEFYQVWEVDPDLPRTGLNFRRGRTSTTPFARTNISTT